MNEREILDFLAAERDRYKKLSTEALREGRRVQADNFNGRSYFADLAHDYIKHTVQARHAANIAALDKKQLNG